MRVTHLSIVTPAATRFDGDVELAIAPGSAGDLGALALHAPLLTTLRVGVVKANVSGTGGESVGAPDAHGGRVEFAIDGGFMEVLPNRVVILADRALSRDEINVAATREELRRAAEALAQKRGADDAAERRAVAWAQAKLEVRHIPAGE